MLTVEEKLQRSKRRFEFIGAIVCAVSVACLVMMLDGSSLQPVNHLTLTKFSILALICYLAIFRLVKEFWILPISRIIPSWILTALIGAVLSVHVGSFVLAVGARNLYALFILSGLCSGMAFIVMGIIYSIGFVVRLIQKDLWESKVLMD
jgi:hypothetical protein